MDRRSLKEDDGTVPTDFRLERRADALEVALVGIRPVGEPIEGAAIADQQPIRVEVPENPLQADLHSVDRPLQELAVFIPDVPVEAMTEEQRGGFGHDLDG